MAAKHDEPTRDHEFEKAFNEEGAGGMHMGHASGAAHDEMHESPAAEATETAPDGDEGGDGGKPAAVVIVAEPAPAGEQAANEKAAQEAKQVNDTHNAAASTNKSTTQTTGEQEAGAAAPEGSAAEEAAETPAQEKVEEAGEEAKEDPKEEAAESPAYEKAEEAAEASGKAPMTEQQLRSWEGRLKKLEADLKAKASQNGETTAQATGDALKEASSQAKSEGDTEQAQGISEVAQQVKSGEISPQDAMRMLAEDFGDDFVKMIQAIASDSATGAATKAVGDKIGKLQQDTQGIIDHLSSSAAQAHFQQIHDKHPDFVEVSKNPAFEDFVKAHNAQAIVDNGSARQINKLLDEFKASQAVPKEDPKAEATQPAQQAVAEAQKAAPAQVDPMAADAAEGVRSAGLRIPEKPARGNSDDFASAWEQF